MFSAAQQHELTRFLLHREPRPASGGEKEWYFASSRLPGTMSVGLRKTSPEIFQDTCHTPLESYGTWLHRTLGGILQSLTAAGVFPGRPARDASEVAAILRAGEMILDFETAEGHPLHEAVPQQMYEDVFVRILCFLKAPETLFQEIHLYRPFNALCRRFGLMLIDLMEQEGMLDCSAPDLDRLIQISVLSGYVGINLKSTASAASELLNRERIPLPPEWVRDLKAVDAVPSGMLTESARRLLDLSRSPEGRFALSSLSDYHREVVDTETPTLLVFFCDDYLESLIDLKRFQIMLTRNPALHILFVPRNGRCGNDLSIQDVPELLRAPQFRGISSFQKGRNRRLHISRYGPRTGCLDPREISAGLIREVNRMGISARRKVIFETKGCRNFEMVRGGLQVPWYAAFNCNRALSIRTVQADGFPVFLRIPPGVDAYDGFTEPRIGSSPSYETAGVRFARMTTRQLFEALETPLYRDLLENFGNELLLNTTLTRLGRIQGMTFAELIASFSGRETDLMTLMEKTGLGALLRIFPKW